MFFDEDIVIASGKAFLKQYNIANTIYYITSTENLILMQYIGRKDKNGKEIYEKDICEYRNDRGVVYKGVVKYIKSCAAYKLVFDDDTWTDLTSVKIIGNIFKNPQFILL